MALSQLPKAELFREALLEPSEWWNIEHVDITCDSCEVEPIVGKRYKCAVCDDTDFCAECYQSTLTSNSASVTRGLECRDHDFTEVQGPERAIRFLLPPKDATSQPIDPGIESKAKNMLQVYLDTFPPSFASCEHVAWICLSFCPSLDDVFKNTARITYESVEERIDALLEEFEGIEERGESVTARLIDRLAAKYQINRGKWMCFPQPSAVDQLWSGLALALASGELHTASEVKVAPRSPERMDHAICVYTENYLDQDEILQVRDRLRSILPYNLKLFYKPDIYTVLGIYRGNKWGLSASIMVDPG